MIYLRNIYKILVKKLFFIIYGKIILETNVKKNIYKKFKFKYQQNKISVFNVNNCRVFTDTRDVAYISKNNELITDLSIQLAKNINDNFVIKNGTPKFFKSISGNSISLLSGSPANQNYFHWIFDVIPRFFLISQFYKFNKNDNFIIAAKREKFQNESLEILGVKKIINLLNVKHLKTRNLYCVQPEMIKYAHKTHFPEWMLEFLKKKFLIKKFKSLNFDKIYISRNDSQYKHLRYCENEKELISFLKQKKFKVIEMSGYSIKQQAYIFNKAKCIISIHGAAFANMVFCNKNCKIIELKTSNTNKIIEFLARDLKLKNFVSLKFKNLDSSLKNIGSQFGKFYCDLNVLKKNL